MATRSNIELYDGWGEGQGQGKRTVWHKGVVLYHHWDGYPSWMGPELERILQAAKKELAKARRLYWWDSERVGALMIKLSADGKGCDRHVPRFKPCVELHRDIEYLWRVFLGPKDGEYEIQCASISHDWKRDVIEHLEPVDWRKEID